MTNGLIYARISHNKQTERIKMIYLIIKEIDYNGTLDNSYRVMDFANDVNKANDMLQGYRLIEKDERVVYSIVRYESPLILTKEMEVA